MARFLLCRLLGVEYDQDTRPWLGALDGFTDAAILCLLITLAL